MALQTTGDQEMTRRQMLLGSAAVGALGGLRKLRLLPSSPSTLSAFDAAARLAPTATKGTVVIDSELEPHTLNGLDENDQYLAWIYQLVQESLYVFDSSLKSVPWLTTDYPKTIDALHQEITLKRGIRFQNGDEFTSEHVVATINVGKTPGHVWNFHLGPLANAEAIGKYGVRFTFNQPWALLQEKLSVIPMMHKDWVNKSDSMMGTGPFKFVSHTEGVSVKLAAWNKYRLGAPHVAGVTFRFVPDDSARLVDIINGTSTINSAPDFSEASLLAKNNNLTLVESVAPITLAMRPNLAWRPFHDVRVRQALAYSMNREKIRKLVFSGRATIGQGPIGPGQYGWEYTKTVYPATPNLDRARSLLAAAGYANKSIPFTWVATEDVALQNLGAVLKADWAAVGFDASLRFLQLAEWIAAIQVGQPFGICIEYDEDGTGFGNSPAPLTYALQKGNLVNTTSYNDAESNRLITEANAQKNLTKRAKLYAQWSDLVATNGGWLAPAYPHWLMAHRKQLTGLPSWSFKLNALDIYRATLS